MEPRKYTTQDYIIQIILRVIGLLIALWVFKQCESKPVETIQLPGSEKISKIETKLQPIIEKSNYYQAQADNTKPLLKAFESRFDSLNYLFQQFKDANDTNRMVVYCDSIRNDYANYQITSKKVINSLDSANIGYRYIIDSKDTIIEIYKADATKLIDENQKLIRKNGNLKKQRNVSIAAFLAALGVAILK